MPFIGNILDAARENTFFRKVLFTGSRSQLVVMSIPPGGEIGEEKHLHVEQTLFFLEGSGVAILNGQESIIQAGSVAVVTPGTMHNFKNTGDFPMKVYTVYAPPNHLPDTIHKTIEDAKMDVKDEDFGEHVV